MAIHVLCPRCGTRYALDDERAGKTGTCPACGTVARIPSPDEPAEGAAPPEDHDAHLPQPAAYPYAPAYDEAQRRQEAALRMEGNLRLLAILTLIMGGVSLLWSIYMLYRAWAVSAGRVPLEPGSLSRDMVATFIVVLAVLAIGTAVVELVAGIMLLRRSSGCRTMGIIAGVVSCASLWQCCVFPFCLAVGIYALVVLCGRDARDVLDRKAPFTGPMELP